MSTVEVRNLHLTFFEKNNENKVLRDISFDVDHGEIVSLLGLSGAGKTSLLRTLNLLQMPDKGQIKINEIDLMKLSSPEIRTIRRKIGIVFQQFNLFQNKTVYENIAFPLKLEKQTKAVISEKVQNISDELNIRDKLMVYPSTLSGGEKQRVAIARSMIVEPELLLLDEPTSALDPKTKLKILETVNFLNKKHDMTTIVVTHDMDVVKKLSDKVAYLKKGQLVFFGEPQNFFSEYDTEINTSFDRSIKFSEVSSHSHNKPTTIVVYFWGEKAEQPILWNLSQKFDVQINILSGQIEHFKYGKYGHLVCEIEGRSALDFIKRLQAEVFKVEVINHV